MAQATEGVPQWLVKEHRKYLKTSAKRVVDFRTRIVTALDAFVANERRKVQMRVSNWTFWQQRMTTDWRGQGYDLNTITEQLVRDHFLRQLNVAARRAQAMTDYQQQQRDGGFF